MSPTLKVILLAVLWLIVVVPMIVRRGDERARTRSVTRLRGGRRALTGRAGSTASRPADLDALDFVPPRRAGPRAEVFVTGTRHAAVPARSVRRPVPAAEEAPMFSAHRTEMSAARAQMMARRRRSLAFLGVGSVVTVVLAAIVGGVTWAPALLFVCALGGYLYFLRGQAARDRERRAARQQRASTRRSHHHETDVMAEAADDRYETAVRIDDEDIDLETFDTIDLTGLYPEAAERPAQRRAS